MKHRDLMTRPQEESILTDPKDPKAHSQVQASMQNVLSPPPPNIAPANLPNNTCFPKNIERMFETFHQSPHGDFRPTFYNPFEVKHRRRTTKAQYRMLEKVFQENCKPPAGLRRQLAARLGMTPRSVQVWFQNRRAKLKTQQVKTTQQVPGLSRSASGSDLSLLTASTCCTSLEESEQASPNMHANCDTSGEDEGENDGAQSDPNADCMEIPINTGEEEESCEKRPPMRPRSNSCPSINPMIQLGCNGGGNVELPFKPLQEALFGNFFVNTQMPTPPSIMLAPTATTTMYPVYAKTCRSRSQPAIPPPNPPYHHPSYMIPAYPVMNSEGLMEDGNGHHVYSQNGNVHIYYPTQSQPATACPQQQQQPQPNLPIMHHSADPVDFDYLLQNASFADQWLYYPHHHQQHHLFPHAQPHQHNTQPQVPPDAFLMSFVEDIGEDGQFAG